MVGDQLHRDGIHEWRHRGGYGRERELGQRVHVHVMGTRGIGDQNDLALTRCNLLHVGHGLLEHAVVGRDDDHGHAFVDERNRPMLELARGVALGVNVGDFLELERTLQRERKAGAPTEIEDVAALGEIAREVLDLRLERERLRHQARSLGQRAHHLALLLLGQHSASAAGRQRKTGEYRKLAREGLGRRDADLGASERRHHRVAFARDRRAGDIHHRERMLFVLLGVAQRRERVGGLTRLRHENR